MKILLKRYAVAAVLLLAYFGCMTSCTGQFEEYNTNPYGPTPEQMKGDNADVAALISQMYPALCQTERNNSQVVDQLVGSDYGYMMAPVRSWDGMHHLYTISNPPASLYGQAFELIMPQIYTGFFQIRDLTEGSGVMYSWAQILRIAGTFHLSDIYGPVPYSQVTGSDYKVAYDDMPTLYQAMFDDLDAAITVLNTAVQGGDDLSSLADADPIYNGDFSKWVKFANTLRLRMAMRISGADATLAKAQARAALAGGVMEDAADSAWNTSIDINGNGYWVVCYQYGGDKGEMRVSASMVNYLVGYEDPRLTAYLTKQTYKTGEGQPDYVGVLNGIDWTGKGVSADHQNLSNINVAKDDPLLIMTAAEAWFLKAEAKLLWGSEISEITEDAKSCYEKGIQVSMNERDVAIGDYLTHEGKPAQTYSDLTGQNNGVNLQNNWSSNIVSVKWADGEREPNHQRILIQKWLANFPNGWETWADLRRIGSTRARPNFYARPNVVDYLTLVQRLKYPDSEYNSNPENVANAVSALGGQGDDFRTNLWWANQYYSYAN